MYTIYALVDPRDYTVHYVGQTTDVYKRFSQHISGGGGSLARTAWIFELRTLNKMVLMETLEEVETYEHAIEREKYWIKHFDMLNEPVSNVVHMGPLVKSQDNRQQTVRSAMSRGLSALKRHRTIKSAAPVIGNDEDITSLFFEKQLSANAIIKKKWPRITGGSEYQKKTIEINNAIRAYAEAAQEANGSIYASSLLSDFEIMVGHLYFGPEQLNPNAIVKKLWPEIKGGDAYQKKSVEVNEAIRNYVDAQRP